MANLMAQGAAWLGAQLKQHAGTKVRIVTGYVERRIPEIIGTVLTQEYEIVGEDNFKSRFVSYDWTFVVADLIDDRGDVVKLKRGDYIEIDAPSGNDADMQRWEIMPPDDNRDAVEPHGATGMMVLVHSKKTRNGWDEKL